jgi:hypothetical protein
MIILKKDRANGACMLTEKHLRKVSLNQPIPIGPDPTGLETVPL